MKTNKEICNCKKIDSLNEFSSNLISSRKIDSCEKKLIERFPGVYFQGNCAKIIIQEGVTIAKGSRIIQNGTGTIMICGKTNIAQNCLTKSSECADLYIENAEIKNNIIVSGNTKTSIKDSTINSIVSVTGWGHEVVIEKEVVNSPLSSHGPIKIK